MTKQVFSLLLCLILICTLAISTAATSPLIQDFANLMISDEEKALTDISAGIQDIYGLDVVILTVPSTLNTDHQTFADDFYDNNGYGENGLLFLLDIGARQWYISTAGTAIELLNDRELDAIGEKIVPYLSEGRYYEGFETFLEILPRYLDEEYETGFSLFLSLAIGAVISGIALLIMRSSMNSKKPQHSAESYLTDGSYHLRQHQDFFLYSNISKRAKPKENTSGSSTHRSSSGRNHGGRGGSF